MGGILLHDIREYLKTMKYTYTTQGTCSRRIDIEIDNGRLVDVVFTGGCHGNLQGIGALVKGMDASEVIERLRGIRCGAKTTSCPDQLARALQQITGSCANSEKI